MSFERPSLLRSAPGVQLFASSADDVRARRPTDVALVVSSLLVLVLTAVVYRLGSRTDSVLSQLLDSLPAVVDALWRTLAWSAVLWSVALVPIAAVRGRVALVRDLVVAVAVVGIMAAGLVALLMDDGRSLLTLLADRNGPPVFPLALLAGLTALLSTASPHLTRPARYSGRWLTLLSAIALVGLDATTSSGALGSVAVGLMSAGLVHLAFGSPGGRPTSERIELALRELGVDVRTLQPAEMSPAGHLLIEGTDDTGPLLVKVYGRDA